MHPKCKKEGVLDCLLHYPIEGGTTEAKGVGFYTVCLNCPMPILENSVANITANISYVRYINISLIIIHEVSMCPLQVFKIIGKLLRDLCHESNKRKPFGGKTILLCGDFQQILPVIPHESRGPLIENCVTSWREFSYFHKITLTRNMRALSNEREFVEFLKKKW